MNLAESIGSRLTYFNELEVISKVFDTPGEVIVLSEPFVPMLARLDECLEYVQSHVRSPLHSLCPPPWRLHLSHCVY